MIELKYQWNKNSGGYMFLRTIQKISYSACLWLILVTHAQPKTILFDFGDTLAHPNHFSMVYNMGREPIQDFLGYIFVDMCDPRNIEKKTFDYLFLLQTRSVCPHTIDTRTTKGRIMPPIMRDWLAGIITGEEIYKKAVQYSKFINKRYFTSSREKKLVLKTIESMFHPRSLAHIFYPIDEAVALLEELSVRRDVTGTQEYTLMICSNMDSLTFDILYSMQRLQKLFSYFKPENIIISADYRNIKPEKNFFEAVLKKYNLNPQDCVLIDDRKENVDSARACHMKAIRVKDKNYSSVRKQLQILKILS